MKLRTLMLGLAATTALTAVGLALVDARGMRPAEAAVSAEVLLDPAYLRKARCSGPVATRPGVQVAGISITDWVYADTGTGPALRDDLGDVSVTVSTDQPEAQRYFDQGLRWAYGFNHGEAIRNFRKAQEIDPTCALCYWGEAFSLGPNINAPMEPQAGAPALAAVQKAVELKADASPKEQALIEAIAVRYDGSGAVTEESAAAFAASMRKAASAFPDDPNIQALFAESLMDTQPWNYWDLDGKTPKGATAEAIEVLERTIAANPMHPAAIHLYIHMTEASADPHRAEKYADRLGTLVPGSGHLVHMPSHVYYRIGRYIDSLEANRAAAAADEAYLAQTAAEGIYPAGYYPHNIHFMVTSSQMAGLKDEAIAASERLKKAIDPEVAAAVGWVQPIAAAPYFAIAQMGSVEEIRALPDPGDELPYVKAAWHYARGVAHAREEEKDEAEAEVAAIAAIREHTDWSGVTAWGVPVPYLLEIAELVVQGRIAQYEEDSEGAIEKFKAAAAIEKSIPYMEPPFWYYPVEQSLGAAQFASGDPAAAEQSFRSALMRHPNSAWAYFGLAKAMRAQGDTAGAEATDKLFAKSWAGDPKWLTLEKL
jgi:tetratricopeptide (TPR) repeat protein